ncbi:MAG TPA: glutathionylspermidine synthase family protein, partial [Candidatus Elarobacter sp.]|nr:glutathionylspermidine synthase family protein [Candidatus Elarobacter sp.]
DAIRRHFLPTYLDRPEDGIAYVRKPVLGREGLGVAILDASGTEIAWGDAAEEEDADGEPGYYEAQPAVFQRYVRAPRRRVLRADGVEIDGEELVTCFIVAGRPSAIGMRIGGAVIDAGSHFAPIGVID